MVQPVSLRPANSQSHYAIFQQHDSGIQKSAYHLLAAAIEESGMTSIEHLSAAYAAVMNEVTHGTLPSAVLPGDRVPLDLGYSVNHTSIDDQDAWMNDVANFLINALQ